MMICSVWLVREMGNMRRNIDILQNGENKDDCEYVSYDWLFTEETEKMIVVRNMLQRNLTITTKIVPKNKKNPKGPKKGKKRPQMRQKPKQKHRAVVQKPKLIFYIGRSQNSFST